MAFLNDMANFLSPATLGHHAFDAPNTTPPPGQPARPGYNPSYDPLSMGMSPDIQDQLSKVGANDQGLGKYRQEALRTGPSAWAGLANQQQDALAMDAQDKAAKTGAGAQASAQSQLAMHGGINSGARERVARDGMSNQLNAAQDIRRGATQNKTQIGMNDEQNRMTELANLPGMEQAQDNLDLSKINTGATAKQYDINNTIGETDKLNAFNMNNYNQQLQAWGAGQIANGMQASKPSGKK